MSAGGFWARSRARRDAGGEAAAAPDRTGKLTTLDRCDRCGAQAYVRVLLPSRLALLFCAHHNRQHARALVQIAVEIQDETTRHDRAAA